MDNIERRALPSLVKSTLYKKGRNQINARLSGQNFAVGFEQFFICLVVFAFINSSQVHLLQSFFTLTYMNY